MWKLLVGLGVLVVLLVAAAVIIPFAVPVEVYSARVAALVKQATGRELKIAGPVRLSVLPMLALEANDVSFANMPGARTPDMVALKRLRLQVQLWPLLHRRIVVNRLVLVRPVIALEVDKAGHPNWVFGPTAAPAAAPAGSTAEPAAVGGGFGISGLALRKVEFSDGKISYLDQRTGKAERLAGINMSLSLRSLGSALASDGSAVWNGERVTFAVSVDKPHALLYGAESQVGIKLAAAPLTLNLAGRVMGSPSLKLDGAIDLETTSLRRLAQWAGSPIALSGDGLGPFALKGTLAIAGTTTSFNDADISLDAIRAKGSVSVDNAGARPAVAGSLDVDRLDLNPYLAPQTASTTPLGAPAGGPAPESSAAAQNGSSDMSFDLSALRFADVDFDLKVGGIVYRQFQTGASAVGVHIKDGRLTADLIRMALYRGSGHGRVTVDGGGAVPTIGLDAALIQVQIQPLAQAAIGIDRLTGAGDLDIAVTARGNSRSELIGTLSGRGAINLANGQIKGVNLPALAESTAKIERDLINSLNVTGALNLLAHGQINAVGPLALVTDAAKSLVGGGNVTNFATLTATCAVTNGLLRNNDLRLQLGAFPLTGAGIVDLRTRVVNYRVSLQLAAGIAVPIQVSGTWDNLSYQPDLSAMLTQTPGNALAILKSAGGSVGKNLEGVGQGLKSVGQDAVGALKGLFGQ
jgi:AsmA protein